MVRYSFSQMGCYEQCPKKYQYAYIQRLPKPDFESTYDLVFGGVVHDTLEWLYLHLFPSKSQKESLFSVSYVPSKEDLISFFLAQRKKETSFKNLLIKEGFSVQDYERRGKIYLERYYDQFFPFTDGVKGVEVEKELVFTLPGGQEFKGYIDRLDELEDGSFVINDYKTNRILPSQDKNEYYSQLTLYAYGLQQILGKKLSIKARLHYLHFDLFDEWAIHDEVLSVLVERYQNLTSEIDEKRDFLISSGISPFSPYEGPYCSYCEYASECPLRKHRGMSDTLVSDLSLGEDIDVLYGEKMLSEMIIAYGDLSKELSSSKKDKDALSQILTEGMFANAQDKLFLDECVLSLRQTKSFPIKDEQLLRSHLQEIGKLEESSVLMIQKLPAMVKEGFMTEDEIATFVDKKISFSISVSSSQKNEDL